MKKVIKLLVVAMVFLSWGCSSRRSITVQVKQSVSAAELERCSHLSTIFGMKLTVDDNLLLYDECSRWLGVPYKWGGNDMNGIDCSGLVKIVFKRVYGVETERNSALILERNCVRIKRSRLREGDLVFFNTAEKERLDRPSHVGIYLKNNYFIHVSSLKGVMMSDLDNVYFRRCWLTGGRVKYAKK
jgi:hypothetical protein